VLSEACHAAALEAGHPVTEDLNGKDQEGVTWFEMNIVEGVRQSAADGYLRPVLTRPNLTVVPDAVVHRLTFSGDRCTGIEYVVAGQPQQARADREVVLSAGAVGTPKLLMLSGIAPAHHLREHGIYVRTEMTGPRYGYTIVFSLMRPHSRGTVRLAGDDPAVPPLIDPNMLGDRRDMDTMVAGLRLARRVGETGALSEWRAGEAIPGPDMDDDADLRRYVRQSASPFFHAAGTCRIGTDHLAVVDSRLRVHGVHGLRVADASVMPALVGANPNATVYAIAERASALLLE
jgi:choline dehydrogenase